MSKIRKQYCHRSEKTVVLAYVYCMWHMYINPIFNITLS